MTAAATPQYQYICQGIHASLPQGRAAGELIISRTHLEFNIKGKCITLSFEGLEISQGGASDRLVFFSHPANTCWHFYCSDRSVLTNPILKQYAHLNSAMTQARNKRQLNWLVLALVAGLCVLLPILLLLNMGSMSKLLAERVPIEWEEQLASVSFNQYARQVELMDDEANLLLAPLVMPLLGSFSDKRYQYRFYISDARELNAFALPGGIVVINAGLILAADSAEELLGVLAHEIVHVREQHGIRNLISSANSYLILTAVVGDVSGLMAVVVNSAPLLLSQSYSRQFETEADERGFDTLVNANINPKGLALFFNKLLAKENVATEGEDSGDLLNAGVNFLRSHPATVERIEQLKSRTYASDNKGLDRQFIDLSTEFNQLQAAVTEFVDTAIDDVAPDSEPTLDTSLSNTNVDSNSSSNTN